MNLLKYAPLILIFCTGQLYAACNIVNGKAYGDCAGVNINNSPTRFLEVSLYISESGIINGAEVSNGGVLNFSGISNGNITVKKGGKLIVRGIVNAAIINNGGTVEIEGEASSLIANAGRNVIGGIVSNVSGNAKVNYRAGAVVGGVPVN